MLCQQKKLAKSKRQTDITISSEQKKLAKSKRQTDITISYEQKKLAKSKICINFIKKSCHFLKHSSPMGRVCKTNL